MTRALTPKEIRDNEKLAETIISKPWFTSDSQNPHPFGSIQRQDLNDRVK